MKFVNSLLVLACMIALAPRVVAQTPPPPPRFTPVTVENFTRAETDLYFGKTARQDGFGKLNHARQMTSIDRQDVVRMNRDTIYSSGVFDLDAAPLTVTLPDVGKRFMSMQVISEDHYTLEVVYAPGSHTYTKDKVGSHYVFIIIRTLANPQDPIDMKDANAAQDAIQVEQAAAGKFEVPSWEPTAQSKIRDALAVLGSTIGSGGGDMFGAKGDVDPILHLIGTAIGWGGNPRSAAVYQSSYPKQNDGRTVHRMDIPKEVPVDGFWSISVYNSRGYFEKNSLEAYSINSLTAAPNPDGSYTIQFGGARNGAPNYLPIMSGWNYTVRLYHPRKEVIDGTWAFPEAQPVR